jgi:hypothetical protein
MVNRHSYENARVGVASCLRRRLKLFIYVDGQSDRSSWHDRVSTSKGMTEALWDVISLEKHTVGQSGRQLPGSSDTQSGLT